MTDNLLHSLEEKMMILLTELEDLRKENGLLKHENTVLKTNQAEHTKKLQNLLSLLDALDELPQSEPQVAYRNEEDFVTA